MPDPSYSNEAQPVLQDLGILGDELGLALYETNLTIVELLR